MRARLALLFAVLTSAATPAWAQSDGSGARAHRMTVIGPHPSALSAAVDNAAPLPSAPLPRPPPVGALLTPLGAQAPQCRTQCAATRYTCLAQEGDGLECNNNWNRCVLGCGGSAYRFSSTSPRVFTQGSVPR